MTKSSNAACAAGIVLVDAFPIVTIMKLCQGIGPSTGVALIDKDKSYYLTNTASDVDTALGIIISAFTTLNALPLIGGAITAQIAQLTALKAILK